MTAPITDGGTRELETAGSATEADDLYRQLDQSPSPSDKRLGFRGGQEGSAVLDASLGADAGMDGTARGRGEALGNEVVLGGGKVLLGLAEEGLGVVEPLGLGHQAAPTVAPGMEPMSATPSRRMSPITGSPERASCWNWLGVNTRTSQPLPTLVPTAS